MTYRIIIDNVITGVAEEFTISAPTLNDAIAEAMDSCIDPDHSAVGYVQEIAA